LTFTVEGKGYTASKDVKDSPFLLKIQPSVAIVIWYNGTYLVRRGFLMSFVVEPSTTNRIPTNM